MGDVMGKQVVTKEGIKESLSPVYKHTNIQHKYIYIYIYTYMRALWYREIKLYNANSPWLSVLV